MRVAPAPVWSFARKIQVLLTPGEQRQLTTLFVLIVISTLLEALSIGAVISALGIIASGGAPSRMAGLQRLLWEAEGATIKQQVVVGVVLMTIAYAVKNAFLGFSMWRQTRFATTLSADLGQRLFSLYLDQPYTFHLQRNSAHLMNNIGDEVVAFSSEVVLAGLLLFSECLVLITLAALMIWAEPAAVLIVGGIVGGTMWILQRSTQKRAVRFGALRLFHAEQAWQHLQQGLGAAKEIILLGRQPQFLAQYYSHNVRRAEAATRNEVMRQLPKYVLEVLAIAALSGLSLIMIWLGRPVAALPVTLGFFAAVAFRMLPSVNRILFTLQTLRYASSTTNRLYDEFTMLGIRKEVGTPDHLALQADIRLVNVSYAYAGNTDHTLENVSLRIVRGASVGIIGASGAGKSTLIDILLGLLEPLGGAVEVDGIDIRRRLRGWQNQIGYVPQVIYITDDSLRRNIAFGVADSDIDNTAIEQALAGAQLTRLVERLPHGLDTLLGEQGVRISGGERQRVGIARALYHDPSVLVLDEATSSLDVDTERDIVSTVRQLSGTKTTVIVTHRTTTIEHCDHVYELVNGGLQKSIDRRRSSDV